MAEEQIKEVIEKSVEKSIKEAVHKELGAYKIPKERHYMDHMWLADWRNWQGSIKSAALRAIMMLIIGAIGALIFYGFLWLGGGGKH